MEKQETRMSVKCLMIETTEKKRFFTLVGAQKSLKEFCKALKAKMQVVRADVKKSQLLTIPKLVVALCDKSHKTDEVEFTLVEQKKKKRSRAANSSRR